MYDNYDSDEYFFTNEITSILENKDLDKLINLTNSKHLDEKAQNISPLTKRNDLIIWNVIFAREIIKSGTSRHYIHTLYNKYYELLQKDLKLYKLQEIELKMINDYFDILINYVEVKNNFITNKILGILYIHIETPLTLQDIANTLNMSVGYLSTTFKKNMGMSIMKYLRKIKIDRAKILLTTTDKSLLEISTLLCFCDQGNFSKTFKYFTGLTPTEYKNNISLELKRSI